MTQIFFLIAQVLGLLYYCGLRRPRPSGADARGNGWLRPERGRARG